jgi:hypothetical protein
MHAMGLFDAAAKATYTAPKMTNDDKTLLLVEDDRPLRLERRPSRSGSNGRPTVSVRPRDQDKASAA